MRPPPEGGGGGITLEPLGPQHAEAMFTVVSEPALYRYLDYGPPPSAVYLHDLYARLAAGAPPESGEVWLNWVIRPGGGEPAGYVQATVMPAKGVAWIAYVLGARHQGRGHATHACRVLMDHVRAEHGVERWLATAERDNAASIAVLGRLGFRGASDDEAAMHELSATERLYLR